MDCIELKLIREKTMAATTADLPPSPADSNHHNNNNKPNFNNNPETSTEISCSQHIRRRLELFCQNCNEVCCAICWAERHNGHQHADLDLVGVTFRDQLVTDVARMKVRYSELERVRMETEDRQLSLMKHAESTKIRIWLAADKLKAEVDLEADKLASEMDELVNGAAERIGRVLRDVDVERGKLISAIEKCEQLGQLGTIVDVARGFKDLHMVSTQFFQQARVDFSVEIPDTVFAAASAHPRDFLPSGKINFLGEIVVRSSSEEAGVTSTSSGSGGTKLIRDLAPTWDELSRQLKHEKQDNAELLKRLSVAEEANKELENELQLKEKQQIDRDRRLAAEQEEHFHSNNNNNNNKRSKASYGVKMGLAVAFVLIAVALKYIFFSSPTVVGTLSEGRPIWGVTSLDDELFVLRHNELHVYNSTTFDLQRHMIITGLKFGFDVTSCRRTQRIYVSDWASSVIHIIDKQLGHVTSWPVNDKPAGLSVTSESTLLVTCNEAGKIKEFKPDGSLIREIQLQPDIVNPFQAIQWSRDQFIISHGDPQHDSAQRVVIVDSDGRIQRQFGAGRSFHWLSSGLMDTPTSLQVVDTGLILVADSVNSRVLMLNQRLELVRSVVYNVLTGSRPIRIAFDAYTGLLYVAENYPAQECRSSLFGVLKRAHVNTCYFVNGHVKAYSLT